MTAAQVQRTVLDAHEEEYNGSLKRLASFKELANAIVSDNYKQSEDINNKVQEMDNTWNKLKDLANAKSQELQRLNDLETKKENLRLEFAEKAKNYDSWVRLSLDALGDNFFGNSLEDVIKYQPEHLDPSDEKYSSTSQEKKAELDSLHQQLQDMSVTENKHTSWTIEDVQAFANKLSEQLKKRREAYEAELKRQQSMEDKRKEFAEHAHEFVKYLDEQIKTLENATKEGDPAQKISVVKDLYKEGADAKSKHEKLSHIDNEAKLMGITENKHTEFTLPILSNKLSQYESFVKNLLSALEEEREMKERSENWEKEWKHKEELENLRIEYATLAQKKSEVTTHQNNTSISLCCGSPSWYLLNPLPHTNT